MKITNAMNATNGTYRQNNSNIQYIELIVGDRELAYPMKMLNIGVTNM